MRWIGIGTLGATAALAVAAGLFFGGAAGPQSVSACDASGKWSGSVSSAVASVHEMEFCSDPGADLWVVLDWRNARKDLRLVVTTPDGTRFVADSHNLQSAERVFVPAPLDEGTYTLSAEYDGKGKENYIIRAVFR